MRTKISRRKKVTDLIEALSKKTNWNVRLALRFLKERYPISPQSAEKHLRSVRSFTEHLQKKGVNFAESILEAATTYSM